MFSLRLAAAGGAIAALAAAQAPPPRYDVVITNGRIVDGTGAPWYRGDVAIAGDRIIAVGVTSDRGAASIVCAVGDDRIVCAGARASHRQRYGEWQK